MLVQFVIIVTQINCLLRTKLKTLKRVKGDAENARYIAVSAGQCS